MSGKALLVVIILLATLFLIGVVVPAFVRAWNTPSSNACGVNLQLIKSGKEQWALEHGKTNGADVTWKDIVSYVGRGPSEREIPHCPHGGVYIIGKLGEQPRCSIGGLDVLPQTN